MKNETRNKLLLGTLSFGMALPIQGLAKEIENADEESPAPLSKEIDISGELRPLDEEPEAIEGSAKTDDTASELTTGEASTDGLDPVPEPGVERPTHPVKESGISHEKREKLIHQGDQPKGEQQVENTMKPQGQSAESGKGASAESAKQASTKTEMKDAEKDAQTKVEPEVEVVPAQENPSDRLEE